MKSAQRLQENQEGKGDSAQFQGPHRRWLEPIHLICSLILKHCLKLLLYQLCKLDILRTCQSIDVIREILVPPKINYARKSKGAKKICM